MQRHSRFKPHSLLLLLLLLLLPLPPMRHLPMLPHPLHKKVVLNTGMIVIQMIAASRTKDAIKAMIAKVATASHKAKAMIKNVADAASVIADASVAGVRIVTGIGGKAVVAVAKIVTQTIKPETMGRRLKTRTISAKLHLKNPRAHQSQQKASWRCHPKVMASSASGIANLRSTRWMPSLVRSSSASTVSAKV